MNVLHHYSPRLKKNLTFHDTNNYMNGKNYSYAASIFNDAHRSEYSFLISRGNPAGKYWSPGRPAPTSPGRPLKILFDNPGDVSN